MTDKVPFHIGGRPFKLLLDIFLYSDLSVEKFVKGLKVSAIFPLITVQYFLTRTSFWSSSLVKFGASKGDDWIAVFGSGPRP